ncbi:DUF192 domain-containing protein [Aestuariibacter halophilus]|uniref:DUF192 domain-containing protein n=1 Tax=Fluctibacter halophilus TaxID=226011 RepID=A0ABS8GD76_9ALTE|nr:DUF192 domain-containing protein [Aestuariibacter halophilus]MCC2617820.1 DUF192 domain-containing protein [Aestuariibacter halophilus]
MQTLLGAAATVLLLFNAAANAATSEPFPTTTIVVGERTLNVEYAQTFEQRSQGLMFRTTLCEHCGMLFRFDTNRVASMWMKNTYLPLDVAYVLEDGTITDIKALQPGDLTPVQSSQPVRYALEMNQGWFAQQGVVVGDRVHVVSPHE